MGFLSKALSFVGGIASGIGGLIPGIGPYIAGSGSAIGALGDSLSNDAAMREYNKNQMELAKYNNEFNRQLWYEQQAYNSPLQQMSRYKDANLNPNLIYSQTNTAGSFQPASVPDLQPNNAFSKLSSRISTANQLKQLELTDSQIEKNQADAAAARENAELIAANKEGRTIWNNLYGTDEFASNFQDLNTIATNRASIDYQRAVAEFSGLSGDPESMSYWELVRNEQVWKNGLRKLEFNLTNDYGAKHEAAVIYNLIYGTKASQQSAAASMVMAQVQGDRLGLDERKYNDVRDMIISHYGFKNLEKSWSALYMMKKYFGTTFDNVFKDKTLKWDQIKTLIDLGKFAVKQQSDNATSLLKILF